MAKGTKAGHPVLRRRQHAGRQARPFRDRRVARWVLGGVVVLGALAVLPFAWPASAHVTQRLATAASLVFMVAAIGLAFGLKARAFVVASASVAAVYAATAWTSTALRLHDLFLLAVLVGFGIFALAGFNLVFVLEEMVYDLHRWLRPRGRAWQAFLPLVGAGILVGMPWWRAQGGPWSTPLWLAGALVTVLLGGWWFLRAFNDLPQEPLDELHLFSLGVLGAVGLAEALRLLEGVRHPLLTSVVAYGALLGTWVYVSYTTLQRTHFLLRGRNVLPWVSLLLAASFAILAHAQVLLREVGDASIPTLLGRRVDFLLAGVWIGLASYVVRSLWLALRRVRDLQVVGPRGRLAAGRAARLAEGMLSSQIRVGKAVGAVLWSIERHLPGRRARRPVRGWDLDPDRHALRPIEEE